MNVAFLRRRTAIAEQGCQRPCIAMDEPRQLWDDSTTQWE
jgi:hypothetical protein